MYNKYEEQNVDRLEIPCNSINLLKENNIKKLGDLSKYTRTNLKDMGLLQNEVTKINVELELLGLGLKG